MGSSSSELLEYILPCVVLGSHAVCYGGGAQSRAIPNPSSTEALSIVEGGGWVQNVPVLRMMPHPWVLHQTVSP